MQTQAIEKIKAEMVELRGYTYVQVVGTMLMQHIEINPIAAEKVLSESKTIKGSLADMEKIAKTKRTGNCAVLTDAEGFAIVLQYFGIEAIEIQSNSVPAQTVDSDKEDKPNTSFDVSLDDLLAGL